MTAAWGWGGECFSSHHGHPPQVCAGRGGATRPGTRAGFPQVARAGFPPVGCGGRLWGVQAPEGAPGREGLHVHVASLLRPRARCPQRREGGRGGMDGARCAIAPARCSRTVGDSPLPVSSSSFDHTCVLICTAMPRVNILTFPGISLVGGAEERNWTLRKLTVTGETGDKNT